MRVKMFLKQNIYFFCILGAFALLWLFFDGPIAGDIENAKMYIPQYYLNLRAGFVSRTFIGTLATLLTGDHITMPFIKGMITVNVWFCYFLLSVFFARVLKKHENEQIMTVIVILAIFAYGSIRYTLSGFWISIFDHYWLSCLLLSLLCRHNKYTKLLIPLLIVVGIWINYGYSLTCLPVLMAFLLYDMLLEGKNQKWNIFIFVLSAVTAIVFSLYFVFLAKNHLLLTVDELGQSLVQRIPKEYHYDLEAINFYLYGVTPDFGAKGTVNFHTVSNILQGLESVGVSFSIDRKTIMGLLLPLLVIEAFWVRLFKKSEDPKKKFSVFMTMLLPLGSLAASFTSTDDYRCFAFGFFSQLLCLVYFFSKDDTQFMQVGKKLSLALNKFGLTVPFVVFIFLLYSEALMAMSWYGLICFILFSTMLLILRSKFCWVLWGACPLLVIVYPDYMAKFGLVLSIICFSIVLFWDKKQFKNKKEEERQFYHHYLTLLCTALSTAAAWIRLLVKDKITVSLFRNSVLETVGLYAFILLLVLYGIFALKQNHKYRVLYGVLGCLSALLVILKTDVLAYHCLDYSYISALCVVCMDVCTTPISRKELRGTEQKMIKPNPSFLYYYILSLITLLVKA